MYLTIEREVRFGSQAAPFVNITLTAGSGGKAVIRAFRLTQIQIY